MSLCPKFAGELIAQMIEAILNLASLCAAAAWVYFAIGADFRPEIFTQKGYKAAADESSGDGIDPLWEWLEFYCSYFPHL